MRFTGQVIIVTKGIENGKKYRLDWHGRRENVEMLYLLLLYIV